MSGLPAIPDDLDEVVDAGAVIAILERAKVWLGQAVQIKDVVEVKARAKKLRGHAVRLGENAEVAASEIIRRAERRLGQLVRKEQDDGTIRPSIHPAISYGDDRPSPQNFFGSHKDQTDSYAMTDGVSDEHFEGALTAARDEKNMSRANVVRKIRGWPEHLLPTKGMERSEYNRKKRCIDPDWVISELALGLEGHAGIVKLINPADATDESVAKWAESIANSLSVLNRFKKELLNGR